MNDLPNYYDVFGISPADIFFAEIAPIATIPATAHIVRKPGKKTGESFSMQQVQIFGELELDLLKDKAFAS